MKEKDGKAARPKFHVYFPIEEITDADKYAAIKRAIHKAFPFFDGNALDAARFIFGSDAGEVVWHEGWVNIDEEVGLEPDDETIETNLKTYLFMSQKSRQRIQDKLLSFDLKCGRKRVMHLINSLFDDVS